MRLGSHYLIVHVSSEVKEVLDMTGLGTIIRVE